MQCSPVDSSEYSTVILCSCTVLAILGKYALEQYRFTAIRRGEAALVSISGRGPHCTLQSSIIFDE